ncbi:MAG: tyrosine-type recombinase/integrase [bacterium]
MAPPSARFDRYLMSLPERTVRSVTAASAGLLRELGDAALPAAVRRTSLYRNMVEGTLRFLIETVGEVKGAYPADGKLGPALKHKAVLSGVRLAARRGKALNSGVHVLRHTFCSHLAMRGAPARAIQELAGHMNITTTQRYMHLSPAAIEGAIRLLDHPQSDLRRGDIVETADRWSATARATNT